MSTAQGYREGLGAFSRNARLFIWGGLFNGLGMSVFSLLFNLYLKEQSFTETSIGQILAAGSLGAAIAAVPAAMVLERVRTKLVLVWSTLLSCACYVLMVLAGDVPMIRLMSLSATMFVTFYRIASSPFLMSESGEGERIYVFSVNSAVGMLSSLLGFLFGGMLPGLFTLTGLAGDSAAAQEYSLYFAVAASLLAVIPFSRIEGDSPAPRAPGGFVHKLKSYDWNVIRRLMIPKIFVGLGAGLVIPFMNLYFRNEFGLDPPRIGFYFSLMQVGLFLGMLSAPILTRRYGMVGSIVLTELLSVPFMLVLALTRNLALAVSAFVMRGMLMNMNLPISANFEMEIQKPEDRPFTNAVSAIAWNGSMTLSAAAGGAIIDRYSFAFSFYVTIVFYLLSAGSYYLLLGRRGTGRDAPEPAA